METNFLPLQIEHRQPPHSKDTNNWAGKLIDRYNALVPYLQPGVVNDAKTFEGMLNEAKKTEIVAKDFYVSWGKGGVEFADFEDDRGGQDFVDIKVVSNPFTAFYQLVRAGTKCVAYMSTCTHRWDYAAGLDLTVFGRWLDFMNERGWSQDANTAPWESFEAAWKAASGNGS